MSEENERVEELTTEVSAETQPAFVSMSKEEHEEQLKKAYQRGANLLYSELIGYLFKTVEVFAANFAPENGNYENFLGFTLHTMGEEFNKKYIEPKRVKDEGQAREEGKPSQGEVGREGAEDEKADSQNQEASQGGHEDVHQGESGRQGANQEAKEVAQV